MTAGCDRNNISSKRVLEKIGTANNRFSSQYGRSAPILTGWRFLQSIEGQTKLQMETPPLSAIVKSWVRWVVSSKGQIDRRAYTFCIIERLVEGLRRRDLFVSPSERWSNH